MNSLPDSSRWGHCLCGVAIPRDRSQCARCERASADALARVVRRDAHDYSRRHRLARVSHSLVLSSICLLVGSAAVAVEGGIEAASLGLGLAGALLVLGAIVRGAANA